METKQRVLIGINVALLALVGTLVALDKITWPVAEAFILGQLVPSVWGAFSRVEPSERKTDPGPLATLALVGCAAAGIMTLSACLEAKQAAAERAYREEQEACLRQYSDKNLRVACVNTVRAKWGGDGGAP